MLAKLDQTLDNLHKYYKSSSVRHANVCKVHATFGEPLLIIRRRSTTDGNLPSKRFRS